MYPNRRRPREGIVLLVCVSIMAVLAVLGATLAMVARLERDVSRNYVDRVRCQILAQSGLEMAKAAMIEWDSRNATSDVRAEWHYGELREKHSGELDPAPPGPRQAVTVKSSGAILPGNPPRDLADPEDPAEYVSFPLNGSTGKPVTAPVKGGKPFAISHSLPGENSQQTHVFSLKVLDSASMIHINDNNHNLEFLLNNLGELLGVNDQTFKLGAHIVDTGEKQGRLFNSKRELRDSFVQALGKDEGEKRFRRVKDFITTHSWMDPTTVWWDQKGKGPEKPEKVPGGGYLTQRSQNADPYPAKCHAWIEPRSPVNINTASKEVLMATLWGLEAEFEDYDTREATTIAKTIANGNSVKIDGAKAEKITNWILAHRYDYAKIFAATHDPNNLLGSFPYYDWMHLFIGNNETPKPVGMDYIDGLTEEEKALVRAAFNPNENIKKLNPDLIMVNPNPDVVAPENRLKMIVRLDKSDIVRGTTEWCFSSMGYYEIECVARIMQGDEILAEERLVEVVKLFDVWRASSQLDFETDRRFETLDDKPLLTEEGYPGVVSLPEYPYNGGDDPYKRYKGAAGDLDPDANKWAADWDGQLVMNGLIRLPAAQEEPKRSFVSGFAKASLGPDQHRHEDHGFHTPRHPEYSLSTIHCDKPDPYADIPAYANIQDQEYSSGDGYKTKKPFVIDPSSGDWSGFWKTGSDLHPFGLYINRLKRGRFHTYWGDEVPAPEGTVEFMVKPEVDILYWGQDNKNCRRMHLFDWSPAPQEGGNYNFGQLESGKYPNYVIRIYAEGPWISASFYHPKTGPTENNPTKTAISGEIRVIRRSVQDWYAHTWHHVELSWAPRGAKDNFDFATAMLFVDGKPANIFERFVLDPNPDAELLPLSIESAGFAPALVLPEDVRFPDTSNNVNLSPRVVFGGKYADVGDGSGMSQAGFIGTLDNLIMHHWRRHSAEFSSWPPSRYLDESFDSQQGYVYQVAGGSENSTGAIYVRRLRFLEEAAKKGPVRLGFVSATHYHRDHQHVAGHQSLTSSPGHVTVKILVRSGGAVTLLPFYYDNAPGMSFPMAISASDDVYCQIEFERQSIPPYNFSPIVDDITVTYFARPKILYHASN